MNKPKKPRTWIMTVGLAAMALAYVYLIFLPGQVQFGKLRAELRSKQDRISESDQALAATDQATRKLDAVRLFIEQRNARTPREDQLSEVFSQIFVCAEDTGTSVTRLEPQRSARWNTLGEFTVHLETESRFDQLFAFLHRLDSLPAPLWVTDLEIESQSEDPNSLRCQLNLTLFAGNSEISG